MDEVWEKSQTVDPEVRAYVYSLVNAVGGSSTYDDTYQVGDDAYAALQDILRWLRLVRRHRYTLRVHTDAIMCSTTRSSTASTSSAASRKPISSKATSSRSSHYGRKKRRPRR